MKSPYHEEGSFHVNFLPLPVTEKSEKKNKRGNIVGSSCAHAAHTVGKPHV